MLLQQPNLRRTVGLWRILTQINRVQGNLGPLVSRHPDGVSWLRVACLSSNRLRAAGGRCPSGRERRSGRWMDGGNKVRELVVDSCRSADGEVEGVTEEFSALEVLSMVNVGLGSLAKLPALPKLRKLEVSDNSISGGLDTLAEKCPNLSYLNLSGNHIKELSSLQPLNLKNLKSLDLYSCGVTAADGYRDAVFRLLPQVVYLDGFDPDDNEVPESNDEDDEAGPPGDEDEEDEEEDEEEGSEVGLSYLMKEGIQDEEDDGDYVEEEEDDEEEEDGEDDDAPAQGEKRKRDADDEGDDDDDE
ncbi:acidic leucine-rich nuclear phosphoprotein 32 family member E-like isoform X2 [Poecilia formosa]|uniref:acidic leucine-rich nuclear phosphoprotein 32 family member E-like isoform X2 n=1 Tax=Poecilia formosa TaxID=48698 RepID=UPI000443C7E1|nr:PREDICTED: acidic leucine-rich nuclear phosphoprotein 32 family member E-like isoform X2 [Poecilia formosa]